MVATLQELDHGLASITPLPTLVFRLGNEFGRALVIGAIPTAVVLCIALDTNLGFAFGTPPVFVELVYVFGPNELAAVLFGTVDAAAVGVLAEFFVPGLFKVVIKESLYMFEGDTVFGAAFGRHVLGIGDRQLEASLEAWVAHAVAALKLDSLAWLQIVHANKTLDSGMRNQPQGWRTGGRGLL